MRARPARERATGITIPIEKMIRWIERWIVAPLPSVHKSWWIHDLISLRPSSPVRHRQDLTRSREYTTLSLYRRPLVSLPSSYLLKEKLNLLSHVFLRDYRHAGNFGSSWINTEICINIDDRWNYRKITFIPMLFHVFKIKLFNTQIICIHLLYFIILFEMYNSIGSCLTNQLFSNFTVWNWMK